MKKKGGYWSIKCSAVHVKLWNAMKHKVQCSTCKVMKCNDHLTECAQMGWMWCWTRKVGKSATEATHFSSLLAVIFSLVCIILMEGTCFDFVQRTWIFRFWLILEVLIIHDFQTFLYIAGSSSIVTGETKSILSVVKSVSSVGFSDLPSTWLFIKTKCRLILHW